ncbi:MAG: hypothetical protein GXO30_06355 [Epsilonproteobacteria bacterium]|nr:hypothetical protein [Campylobacterota bacterium]
MHSISQLEKKQIGLKIPKYLIDEIDEFTKEFSVNRTDIIIEALRSYIQTQKAQMLYKRFDNSVKEVKQMIDGKMPETSLKDLIDELEDNSNPSV